MKIMTLSQFIQQEMESQEPDCQDAILIRLGDFIAALEDQHPDKDRLLEISEDPGTGTYAVRFLPQVPEQSCNQKEKL